MFSSVLLYEVGCKKYQLAWIKTVLNVHSNLLEVQSSVFKWHLILSEVQEVFFK